MASERIWQFSPHWLSTLTPEDRSDLQQWLTDSGVDLRRCPGFDYAPHLGTIWTRYYKTTDQGELRYSMERMEPMYEEKPRRFSSRQPIPNCVKEKLNGG